MKFTLKMDKPKGIPKSVKFRKPFLLSPFFQLIVVSLLLISQNFCEACPSECVCYEYAQRIDCSNRQLTKIPENLPNSVRYLDLSFNKLSELHASDFISNRDLRQVNFDHNQIVIIGPSTFALQKNLELLSIAHNELQTLDNSIFPDGYLLKKLDLSNNLLTHIERDFFSGLRSLEELNLANNSISCIEDKAFGTLYSLKKLYLRGNKLVNFYESNLKSLNDLTEISLAGNSFLCECNLNWFPIWKESHPRVSFDDFKCSAPISLAHKLVTGLGSENLLCYDMQGKPTHT